jgi:hypothetical protein
MAVSADTSATTSKTRASSTRRKKDFINRIIASGLSVVSVTLFFLPTAILVWVKVASARHDSGNHNFGN